MATDPGNDPHAWQPGNPELEALFARALPYVRAFVRLQMDPVVRDREATSDVVQSACREVLASPTFEYRDENAFRSYLCQAALHKLRSRRRHYLTKKRGGAAAMQSLDTKDQAVEHVYRTTLFNPQRQAIGAEEIAQLEAAFAQLSDDHRQALTLYRIAGMPLPDLARHLGRSEAATKMLVHRALARLTTVLRGPADDQD